jgi:hypothetical protein
VGEVEVAREGVDLLMEVRVAGAMTVGVVLAALVVGSGEGRQQVVGVAAEAAAAAEAGEGAEPNTADGFAGCRAWMEAVIKLDVWTSAIL